MKPDFRDGGINRVAQSFHNVIDGCTVNDKRWRNQDVVASTPVGGPRSRIDTQPAFHCGAMDAVGSRVRRCEWGLLIAVGDQLDRPEEAAAANIADIGVIAEAFLQGTLQPLALAPDIRQQAITTDHPLDCQSGRAGNWMAYIAKSVHEGPRAASDAVEYFLGQQDRPDRLVTASETLGGSQQVG